MAFTIQTPVCIIVVFITFCCLMLPSTTESRSIRKRQSGPHNQIHRQRRTLENDLNRLVLIYKALNLEDDPQPAYVHVPRSHSRQKSSNMKTILRKLGINGLTRPHRDIRGPIQEAIRRRHDSRVNDDNITQLTHVPVGNGLQMRVETVRHEDPLTDARQTELVRTIVGLCGWLNEKLKGVAITCFQHPIENDRLSY